MMKRLLCAALLALAFASCGKDPAGLLPEPTPAGADSTATGRPTPPGIVVDHELVEYPTVNLHVPERIHGRIKTIRESLDGNPIDTYHFSADGRLEKYERTGAYGSHYRYNDQGQLIEDNRSYYNGKISRAVYTYDATGNLARVVGYSRDGDTGPEREVGGVSFVYDFSAMTYRATYDSVGTEAWDAAYEVGRFDGQGKVFESTSYHTDGYIVSKWTRTATSRDYDGFFRMLGGTEGDDSIEIQRSGYNWTFTESGDLAQLTTTLTRLDKDSREVLRHYGRTTTYTYTKDASGNWTELIEANREKEIEGDKTREYGWTLVRTREITYY